MEQNQLDPVGSAKTLPSIDKAFCEFKKVRCCSLYLNLTLMLVDKSNMFGFIFCIAKNILFSTIFQWYKIRPFFIKNAQ